jgi:hypothetical protein
MQLDEHDVAGAQEVGGVPDGFRGALAPAEDRDRPRVRVGRDAGDAEGVLVPAEHADDGRAVVAPVERRALRAADHAALDLLEVFVVEAPGPFDVDDADAVALAAGLRVRPQRLDSGWCGAEIDLARHEVGRRGRRLVRVGRQLVVDAGRLGRGLDVRRFDGVLPAQLLGEILELRLWSLHPVEQ